MNNAGVYDSGFYKLNVGGAAASASVVVPRILERFPQAKSVVDFGCGPGIWLNEFLSRGLEVKGYDFGEGIAEYLSIPAHLYEQANLAAPVAAGRKYDIAVSLEVAEHIEDDKADVFVESLCGASDTIVFSAAIPGQGGTHHVNEQWIGYWIEKFDARGYAYEDIRHLFWDNEAVEWWYRQNIIIFEKDKKTTISSVNFAGHSLVHPRLLMQYREQINSPNTELEILKDTSTSPYSCFNDAYKDIKIVIKRIFKTINLKH
jgi:SAM-dependent methyltransferase